MGDSGSCSERRVRRCGGRSGGRRGECWTRGSERVLNRKAEEQLLEGEEDEMMLKSDVQNDRIGDSRRKARASLSRLAASRGRADSKSCTFHCLSCWLRARQTVAWENCVDWYLASANIRLSFSRVVIAV